MPLKRLSVRNYRCFQDASLEGIPQLTILIGENDSGKTSILDAIEILLGRRKPTRDDFRRLSAGDTIAEVVDMEIEATFAVWPDVCELSALHTVDGAGQELRVRRRYRMHDLALHFEVYGRRCTDERFHLFGQRGGAERDKEALESIGIPHGRTTADRQAQFDNALLSKKIDLTNDWIPADERTILAALPDVQRVSASSYFDPHTEILRLAQTAVRDRLSKEPPFDGFQAAETSAQDAINAEMELVRPHLARTIPGFSDLAVTASIDFRRPHVDASIGIDLGRGLQPLAELGDGTRRRAWIALEHRRSTERDTKPLIRLYDEPDVNLHYEAQRTLFRSIRDAAAANTRSTTIVCTHAVTLIDRATPSAIRILRADSEGARTIAPLVANPDMTMLEGLSEAATGLGLTNLSILYERAFLIVEGETEARAIPRLYRASFGSQIEDDGIRVVDIDGCGAWRSVVRVLLEARTNLLHLLLDADCAAEGSSAKLTGSVLSELGLDWTSVTLIGDKEFEDSFADETWIRTLNSDYPLESGTWQLSEMETFRRSSKFSDAIVAAIRARSVRVSRSRASKPELGAALARNCTPIELPTAIRQAFDKARRIAGVA